MCSWIIVLRERKDPRRLSAPWIAQVRAAQEEGSLRIRTLEEALSRLSAARGAGEQGVELTRIVAEAEVAHRAAARATVEGRHLQVRARSLTVSGHPIAFARAISRANRSPRFLDAQESLELERTRCESLLRDLAEREKQLAELWAYAAFGPAAVLTFAPPGMPPSLAGNAQPAGANCRPRASRPPEDLPCRRQRAPPTA